MNKSILLRAKKTNHVYRWDGGVTFTNLTTGKTGEIQDAKKYLIISQRLTELPAMAKKLIELCNLELIN
jgi:hypothetical protein